MRARQAQTVRPVAESAVAGSTDREFADMDNWKRGHATVTEEEVYELDFTQLPSDLEGTFFKNGYAKFEVGEDKVLHPFDGDGMVSAVSVGDGKAFFRNKFVRTEGYKRELKRNKICYRGTFGTKKSGGMLANMFDLGQKNVANTHVLWWGKKLFALWEGGKPYKVDPASLSTFGETVLGGALRKQDNFAAHYKIDPKKNRLLNFCVKPGVGDFRITTFEFNDSFELLSRRDTDLPDGFPLMHDMGITDRYFVFMEAPAGFDPLPFVLGQKGAAQCISFRGDEGLPSRFHLIPRDPKDENVVTIDAPAHFIFHVANAFDDPETGDVVIDEIMAPTMQLGDEIQDDVPIWETVDYEKAVPPYKLVRYRLNVQDRSVRSTEELCDNPCDFPVVHPSKVGSDYRYAYLACAPSRAKSLPVQGILRKDLKTGEEQKWLPEPHEFLSEVAFAPRRKEDGSFSDGEDDGYLVTYLLDTRELKSEFVVFDAAKVADGPVSRVPLNNFIPHGLHGTFVPGLLFDIDKAKRASKLFLLNEKRGWNVVKSDFSGLGANMMFD